MILVGVRGAGKSAAGRMLAGRLEAGFLDLDAEIEKRAGTSIAAIFENEGEDAFRALETEVLAGLTLEESVLATGGGVVLSQDNRERLRELGLVVWLQVSPEGATERCQGDGRRPPLTGLPPLEEAREVARRREPFYREVSHRTVSTDHRPVQEVCDELEQLWRAASRDDLR
jgi:shikimate kinase